MPDLQLGGQTQQEPRDQGSLDAVNRLRARVEAVSAKVKEIAAELRETYPKEGLLFLSKQFENISIEFKNYTVIITDPFYEIIRRSDKLRKSTLDVAREAGKLAGLFEKFSRNPRTYSASKSRIQISTLQAKLTNVQATLPTGTVQ